MIEIFVVGVPAPQGSKVRTKWGIREDNPNTKPWRAAVASEAAIVMNGTPLLAGRLRLDATFTFPRPKSHYRSGSHSDELKATAPMLHASAPDLDKLLRAAGDALTGIAIRDDGMISVVLARKVYGEPAGALLVVSEIEP